MTLKLEHYQTAIENLHDAVMISQCKGGNPLIFVNDSFTQLTGYTLEDVHEKPCEFLYASHDPEDSKSVEITTMQDCMKNRSTIMVTVKAYKKDGTPFHAEVSLSQIKNHRGRTTHYMSLIRDVSLRVSLEKQLFEENAALYQTNQSLKLENKHDLVTGILNRSAMQNEVKGLFHGAKRAKEYFTLFFIGIDAFEDFKNACGQKTADTTLKHFASFLTASLKRESDIVFRYSQSEFIICFTGQEKAASEQFAQKITDQVQKTRLGDALNGLHISTSVGVVSAVPSETELNDYILSADLAMHKAREQGGNQVCISSQL